VPGVRAILLAAGLFISVAPVHSESPLTKKDPKDPDKLICVDDLVTGSRLTRKRTCKTADQWRDYRYEVRDAVNHGQNNQLNPSQRPSGNGG